MNYRATLLKKDAKTIKLIIMPNDTDYFSNISGAGQAAISGILGIGLGYVNDNRQYGQQERLQRLQMQGNKEMVDYNMAKQLQMWKDTNYQAQVEQMKKAGINPGLLYGMSGGGGVTTGNATGNVQGANAPQGGREVQDMIGMGMQLQLLKAQKENIEADTQNKLGDAANKPIVGEHIKTEIQSLTQGIKNQKEQEIMTQIQNRILTIDEKVKGASMQDTIDRIAWETGKALQEMEYAERETYIQKATVNDRIDTIHAEMLGAFLRNALTKMQVITEKHKPDLMETQRTALIKGWVQKWKELQIAGRNSDVNAAKQSQDEWVNDVAESSKIPIDLIEKAVQAIIIKGILTPGRNPIQGFKPNN